MALLGRMHERTDFSTELYGDDQPESDEDDPGSGCEESENEDQDMSDEYEEETGLISAPSLTAPQSRPQSSPERCRSRSPINRMDQKSDIQTSSNIVIRVNDEDRTPFHAEEEQVNVFMTPDAHPLYVCSERRPGDKYAIAEKLRNRSRRGRVRRFEHRQIKHQQSQWNISHPLQEIWITDDDVPLELRNMAQDVVRRREMRRNNVGEEWESDDDVFQDATDEMGNPLLEDESNIFEWTPMDSFQVKEERFKPMRTGAVKKYRSEYDAFRSTWDDGILEHIAAETNLYASKIKSESFQADWYPTNSHEILCLFSFWMMLGVIRMPTIRSCFSSNPLLETKAFGYIFTKTRYQNLTEALQFVNSDPIYDAANKISDSSDRLYHLRPIISHLNAKFQENYVTSKDVCIDESLLWKKAASFGVTTFELCESATGYLWSFIVCTGNKTSMDLPNNPVVKSTGIVKKLLNPLLNKGYRLFMDNCYNSPVLARFLKLNRTDFVGTLRQSHHVPWLMQKAPLKRGQLMARHSGDVCVLTWQDKKRRTMISTCHGSSIGLATVVSKADRLLPFKPQMVLDFDKWMTGVDLKDQLLEPYLLERKCTKWYMKLFKRLLNCSIQNARILLQSSTQIPQDPLKFRLQLVESILSQHLPHIPVSHIWGELPTRTVELACKVPAQHWPVYIEQTEYAKRVDRKTRQKCTVCVRAGRKFKKTTYRCESCNVPLCVVDCFKAYHTT